MLIKNHIRFSRFLSLLLQTNLLVKTDYNMDKKQYNVLDLFCGCGGMSLGFDLMLSTTDKLLYIFRNPVGLYKQDAINASLRNGMEISFDINNFKQTELLTWQD